MTAAAADLQKALFSALAGDAALVAALGGAKVFDNAPAHAAFHRELDLPLAGFATATLLTSGFFAALAASGRAPRRNLILAALGGV